MKKTPKPKVGKDRRVGDRRCENLGGPPIPGPEHFTFTREQAINKVLEQEVEYVNDWDDNDIIEVLLHGWKGKPVSKWSNKELARYIWESDCEGGSTEDQDTVTVGKSKVGK